MHPLPYRHYIIYTHALTVLVLPASHSTTHLLFAIRHPLLTPPTHDDPRTNDDQGDPGRTRGRDVYHAYAQSVGRPCRKLLSMDGLTVTL